MAQTGYTPILIYASGTASAVPSAANMTSSASGAELALNYADGKLYYKNSGGTVTLLASAAGASGDVVGPSSATDNAVARFDGTTGKLIQNGVVLIGDTGAVTGVTDLTASGSVTLSGGTANGVTYLNGSKVLTSGSALVFDGTNLSVGTTALSSGKFSTLADLTAVNGLVVRDSATTYANNDNYVLLQNSTGATAGGLTHPASASMGVWGNDDIRFLQGSGATEGMRLTSTGLGIGTSSPAYKLDVTGNGNFTSLLTLAKGSSSGLTIGDVATNSNSVLRMQGTSAGYNWQIANNLNVAGLEFTPSTATGGTTYTTPSMTLTTTGLGIGTSSPAAPLSFAASTGQKIRFFNSVTGYGIGVESSEFRFVTDSSASFTWRNGTYSGGTTYMTLDASGNLGIGGVSSGKILSIQASDTTNAVNGQAGLQIINTNASAGGRMTTVTFGGRSSSNYPFAAIAGILVSDSAQEQSGDLAFYTKSTTTAANPTERARIYSDGNMALGYSSTSINGLTVGNYSYTTAYAADLGANAADFGYGSSLNVWAQSDTATISGITLETRSTGRSRWDILNVWTNTYLGDLVLRYRSGGTSTAEAMRITSSGIVGIGTNSPGTYSTKFSINGNSTARMMNIDNAGANGVNVGFSNNGTDVGFLGSSKWVNNGTLTDFAIGSVNSLIFSQNGNERARIDGSGRLLVGTTTTSITSSEKFEVNGAGAFLVSSTTVPAVYLQNSDATAATNQPHLYLSDGSANRGALGLVNSTSQLWINGQAGIAFRYGGSGTGTTEAARINSNGFALFSNTGTYGSATNTAYEFSNSTSNQDTIQFRNTASSLPYGLNVIFTNASPNDATRYYLRCADGGGTVRAYLYSNGGLANYQANNSNLSDRREKTNFAPAKSYLDTICAIPVQTFNYIDQNMEDDPGLTLGVVAQDVQAVAPELVHESNWAGKDEPEKMRLSIYQTDLQYALMKCIQELKSELDSVKTELATLKGN